MQKVKRQGKKNLLALFVIPKSSRPWSSNPDQIYACESVWAVEHGKSNLRGLR